MKRSVFAVLLTLLAPAVYPCSRPTPVDPAEMVRSADLIVVARAVGYDREPSSTDGSITLGESDSLVRFEVDEWVKGKGPVTLALNGYLSGRDDFNDQDPPYTFVRPGGRGGSCFAYFYREGARFLLILKLDRGAYTANWYALGPTNEQLRDGDDRWLTWVRAQVSKASSE